MISGIQIANRSRHVVADQPSLPMTANLLRHRTRNPLGVAQTTIIIGLLLSPAFFKIYYDCVARSETISEYQTGRSLILSKVEAAAGNHDVVTLLHYHRKYAGCVTDTHFIGVLNQALAKATAHEAELELTVSKHLDLMRHREEIAARNDPHQASPREIDKVSQPRLSLLPR